MTHRELIEMLRCAHADVGRCARCRDWAAGACDHECRFLGSYWWPVVTIGYHCVGMQRIHLWVCDDCDLAIEAHRGAVKNCYPYRPNLRIGRRRPKS